VLRLLPLALALALLVPGRAEAKLTCSSGKTYYKHARTRVFAVYQDRGLRLQRAPAPPAAL
jgi:hypothetical protein